MLKATGRAGQVQVSTIITLLLALILIFIGFSNGEHRSYFQKAVMICTQCIGLG
ncbi:MAG TPA: CD1871A family CXXC motif-containing protein [Candidatus Rifleibacterium sp.]|nr:CD1871A family CXXC motif-containing protein [Candidatus Rifleibacterium sp.]HPT44310.1 CD1871A family CXXC motif-containing protein [Candidatus Rifleibacterium sp.]